MIEPKDEEVRKYREGERRDSEEEVINQLERRTAGRET